MSPDKFQELKNNFPLLYKDLSYIGIGDGWFRIIYYLSEQLEKEISVINKKQKVINLFIRFLNIILCMLRIKKIELLFHPRATQIKEKFGMLRFYLSENVSKKMDALIYKTEDLSSTICEKCGQPADVNKKQDSVWIKTLCKNC